MLSALVMAAGVAHGTPIEPATRALASPSIATGGVSGRGRIRVVTDGGLKRLLHRGPATVRAAKTLFNNSSTYVTLGEGAETMPSGWHAQSALLFGSFRHFREAAHGGLDPKVAAVVYDNEAWRLTPHNEQVDPELYAAKFADLAHRLNLVFIGAPKLGRRGQSPLFAADARYADILDVQVQHLESTPGRYADMLTAARHRARQLNPDVRIIDEVTSNPAHVCPARGGPCTSQDRNRVVNDLISNAGQVGGFWLWISQVDRRSVKLGAEITRGLARQVRAGRHL